MAENEKKTPIEEQIKKKMALDWPYSVQQKDMHWTGKVRAAGRGVEQEQPGNGTREGKLQKVGGKRTSLRSNQIDEELHEGPMLHIRKKGQKNIHACKRNSNVLC